MYATLALRPEQRLEGIQPPPARIAAATPRISAPPTPAAPPTPIVRADAFGSARAMEEDPPTTQQADAVMSADAFGSAD
eukprot:527348-Prorocentrum_lima.AAC.1